MSDTENPKTFWHSLIAVAGSSLFFAWGFSAHLGPALLYSPDSTHIEYAYFASLGGSAIFAALLCFRSLKSKKPLSIPPGMIFAFASLLSFLTLAEAVVTTVDDNILLLIVLGVLDGICQPLLIVAWGARFTWESNRVPLVVLSSYILAILLYFVISILEPHLLAMSVVVLLPFLSAVVWRLDLKSRQHLAPELNSQWLQQSNHNLGEMVAGISSLRMLPWLTLLFLALTTFLGSLISSIMVTVAYEISSQIAIYSFLFGLLLCSLCLLALTFFPSRFSVESSISYLPPIIVLGMVSILVFGEDGLIISTGLLKAAGLFFEVIVLMLIAYTTQQRGLSPMFSFGFGVAVVYSITFLGHMVGQLFYLIFGDMQKPIAIVIGASIIIMFVLMSIVVRRLGSQAAMASEEFSDNGKNDERTFDKDVSSEWERAFDNKIQRFAQTYGLSNREHEIVRLLVRGRSTPKIAELLFVTSGTIKTHLTHIYRKTNVLGRQELIDLFNKLS